MPSPLYDMADSRGLFDSAPPVSPEDMRELRKHVINLNMGQFSRDGSFTSSKESVDAIFRVHLKQWIAEQDQDSADEPEPIRLLLYAHGGLTTEAWGLTTAASQVKWWREQGVYPIFFVWETGLFETLSQIFRSALGRLPFGGTRDLTSWFKEPVDTLLEAAVRGAGGRVVWAGMKSSAKATFDDSGDGHYVLEHIQKLDAESNKRLRVYGVGHSAGSIFLAHALQAVAKKKLFKCESLHFLAPAITCDLFEETLRPLIGGGATATINSLSMFTMNDDLERADSTTSPYNKSLLYLIYKALEAKADTPILGLEQSLLADPALAKFFGLNGNPATPKATVIFSQTANTASKDASSQSDSHGGFDNDPATMESVLRRILKVNSKIKFQPFQSDPGLRAVSRTFVPQPAANSSASNASSSSAPVVAVPTGKGKRLALCIGIDDYPPPNRLSGCVNDSHSWAKWLTSRGFTVQKLINGQATRAAIMNAIKQLFEQSSAGDVVAIQYAGHGTSVVDVNGDEAQGDSPGKDEALVPVDFAKGDLLLDDDLGELCRDIKAGVNVTFFMDCCNSGTNTRMFMSKETVQPNTQIRYIELDQAVIDAHIAKRKAGMAGMRAFGATPYRGAREILFAACRSNEVALEHNGQGDFTRHAMAVLARSGELTAEQFYSLVLQEFGGSPKQTPGLWCDDALRRTALLGQILAS